MLALGGGSARGLAHIGVIRVLEAEGIPIKAVAGTSIGAIVGGFHAAGVLDQYELLMRGVDGQSVLWFLDPVLPTAGFFEGARVDAMHRALVGDRRIETLDLPYCAVAADIETGEEIRIRHGGLADAMRASLAIPGIFHPHRFEGRWLIDGGLSSPVPIQAARQFGDLPVVAVNLQTNLFPKDEPPVTDAAHNPLSIPSATTRERLAKLAEDERMQPSLRDFLHETLKMGEAAGVRMARRTERLWRRFTKRTPDSMPGMIVTVNDGFAMMQDRLARLMVRDLKPEIVLEPQLPGVGFFDYGRAKEIIAEGERVTREAVDAGAFERVGRGLTGRLRRLLRSS